MASVLHMGPPSLALSENRRTLMLSWLVRLLMVLAAAIAA